jgi:HSP20 family protein
MLKPRFDLAFRSWGSVLNRWFEPYPYVTECEDWVPNSDIAETEKSYVVSMELPGIDLKENEISYHEGILSVKGEKEKETTKDESYRCSERYSGPFQRSFRVPGKVDSDKINTTYKKGILKVTLPKSEESVRKKTTVH